jgi:hypothetical protein
MRWSADIRGSVCTSGYGDSVIRCGAAESVSGRFREDFMTKKSERALLPPRTLAAILQGEPRVK